MFDMFRIKMYKGFNGGWEWWGMGAGVWTGKGEHRLSELFYPVA